MESIQFMGPCVSMDFMDLMKFMRSMDCMEWLAQEIVHPVMSILTPVETNKVITYVPGQPCLIMVDNG